MMARQPAVQLSIFFPVAVDAKLHFKLHRAQAVHACHVAMANRTVQLSPVDVRRVLELHEVGDIVDSHPRHRGPGIVVPLLLGYLRVIGNDDLVAIEAFLHRREPCVS